MADGYEVDPETLRTASGRFYDGADAVAEAAALLALAQLVPAALGQVAAAGELSTAVSRFVDEHGADLRHGAVWVNDAADGLVDNADGYQRTDTTAADGLTALYDPTPGAL